MREVQHRKDRYEIRLDGERVGVSTFRDLGNRRIFQHTEVDPGYTGQGLASELIHWALDDVRSSGMHVVAQCPMVAAYLEKHHEWDDIVDHPSGVEG